MLTIPVEVVCRVFGFLSVWDVVRLRTVCKRFHDITYESEIWRVMYANARVPLPPGPFSFQSTQFLARTLIKSERLARSWTKQPMRILSSVRIRIGLKRPRTPKVINGKWLIGCESSRAFIAHDIHSEMVPRPRQILWKHDGLISHWDAFSVVSSKGPVLYIVFSDVNSSLPWKLLEFRTNSDYDHLYHLLSLDVPMKNFRRSVYLNGGCAPFLHIEIQDLIFDAETQRFYDFPPPGQALNSIPFEKLFQLGTGHILLTRTHIVVLNNIFYDGKVWPEASLVQAFTLPTNACSDRTSTSTLHLTHEAVLPGDHNVVNVVRNSIADPVDGATNIRLLHHAFLNRDVHLICIDLTLPKPAPTDTTTTLPILINTHEFLVAENVCVPHPPDMFWRPTIIHSDEGHVRGFWQFRMRAVTRFTIDASRERCTGVLGETLPIEWDGHPHFSSSNLDATSGKLSSLGNNSSSDWNGPWWPDLAVVVDVD